MGRPKYRSAKDALAWAWGPPANTSPVVAGWRRLRTTGVASPGRGEAGRRTRPLALAGPWVGSLRAVALSSALVAWPPNRALGVPGPLTWRRWALASSWPRWWVTRARTRSSGLEPANRSRGLGRRRLVGSSLGRSLRGVNRPVGAVRMRTGGVGTSGPSDAVAALWGRLALTVGSL